MIFPFHKVIWVLHCRVHHVVVLHHQLLRLYAHHPFHYFVHELPVLHLLLDFLVEPLLLEEGRDVLEADTRVCEGILHVFFVGWNLVVFDDIVVNFPELGAEVPIEIFCFSKLSICTTVHHDFLLSTGLLAVLLFFILLFFYFHFVFLIHTFRLDELFNIFVDVSDNVGEAASGSPFIDGQELLKIFRQGRVLELDNGRTVWEVAFELDVQSNLNKWKINFLN